MLSDLYKQNTSFTICLFFGCVMLFHFTMEFYHTEGEFRQRKAKEINGCLLSLHTIDAKMQLFCFSSPEKNVFQALEIQAVKAQR